MESRVIYKTSLQTCITLHPPAEDAKVANNISRHPMSFSQRRPKQLTNHKQRKAGWWSEEVLRLEKNCHFPFNHEHPIPDPDSRVYMGQHARPARRQAQLHTSACQLRAGPEGETKSESESKSVTGALQWMENPLQVTNGASGNRSIQALCPVVAIWSSP